MIDIQHYPTIRSYISTFWSTSTIWPSLGYAQYFDMTADRIFERVNLLSAELHRLSLAVSRGGAAPTGNGPAAAASERPMSARENVPVVQGQVVEAEAKPMGTWLGGTSLGKKTGKLATFWPALQQKHLLGFEVLCLFVLADPIHGTLVTQHHQLKQLTERQNIQTTAKVCCQTAKIRHETYMKHYETTKQMLQDPLSWV